MAPLMEAWLIADPDSMQRYYGPGFAMGALPQTTNVEQIAKGDLMDALRAATRRTTKGEYQKIGHGPELLARVDARRVRAVAPHCDRLFTMLETMLG